MSRIKNHNQENGIKAYLNFAITLAKAFMVLLLAFLVMVSVDQKKTDGVKFNAEYLITVKWNDGEDWDIDTWLQAPTEQIIWYQAREVGVINLERDDTGNKNDSMIIDGKVIRNPINQEIVSVRGVAPGEYILNVYLYRYNFTDETGKSKIDYPSAEPLPKTIQISVEIKKLNPSTKIVFYQTAEVTLGKQELHITRFKIQPNGDIDNFENSMPISLVGKHYKMGDFVRPIGAPQ